MSDMAPMTPANCDLRDFLFTPVEFQRLLSSETWLLANDAEKVAAITLWGICWSQVPAGSIPSDDRLLAHLSGAGMRWKRVKAMALRGWVLCSDGRYYHPVMCEKALEAWLEKLTQRSASLSGNAKRWGGPIDLSGIAAEYGQCRAMLVGLNPRARALSKSIPKGLLEAMQDHAHDLLSESPPVPKAIPTGCSSDPGGIPTGVPMGSQGTGTGTGNIKALPPQQARARFSQDPETGGASPGGGVDQAGKFAMNPGWEPDSEALQARLVMSGVPPNALTPQAVAEFKSYWLTRPDVFTAGQWSHKFFKCLQQNQGGKNGSGSRAAQHRGGGRQSVSDRVREAAGLGSVHEA